MKEATRQRIEALEQRIRQLEQDIAILRSAQPVAVPVTYPGPFVPSPTYPAWPNGLPIITCDSVTVRSLSDLPPLSVLM